MTLDEALDINGTYVRLLLDHGDSDGAWVHSGRVVGVCVPCPGSPVEPHLLVDCGDPISPCGCGSEVFLSSISRLLYSGDKPSEPTPPGSFAGRRAVTGRLDDGRAPACGRDP